MIRMRALGGGWIECLGQTLRSGTPAFSMARRLIAVGYPPDAPVTLIATTGTPGLTGTLGAFAALTVTETDTRGPRLAGYRDNGWRQRVGRPQASGRTPPTGQATKAVQREPLHAEGPS